MTSTKQKAENQWLVPAHTEHPGRMVQWEQHQASESASVLISVWCLVVTWLGQAPGFSEHLFVRHYLLF